MCEFNSVVCRYRSLTLYFRSIEETYETLEELRKEGKFKYIGISEPSAETLTKAAKVSRRCRIYCQEIALRWVDW